MSRAECEQIPESLEEHLAADLRSRGEIALTQLTVHADSNFRDGGGIADVWAMLVKWTYRVFIYECKKSRADYWRDVRSEKYKRYANHCHYLYFAAPEGLIKVAELPKGTGLIEWHSQGWVIKKRARFQRYRISERQSLAVIFRLARGKTTAGLASRTRTP